MHERFKAQASALKSRNKSLPCTAQIKQMHARYTYIQYTRPFEGIFSLSIYQFIVNIVIYYLASSDKDAYRRIRVASDEPATLQNQEQSPTYL